MRLFSKVSPGTPFKADVENNSSVQDTKEVEARLAKVAKADHKHHLQVVLHSSTVQYAKLQAEGSWLVANLLDNSLIKKSHHNCR